MDSSFGGFCDLLNQAIVQGDFQCFGRKAKINKCNLTKDDFVGIYFPSKRGFKYGIVSKIPTGHTVDVKLLVRRNKDGSGKVGVQTFDVKNLTLLHRPN